MVAVTLDAGLRPSRWHWLLEVAAAGQEVLRLSERGLAPFLDLFVRLWLAQAFWLSGLVKISDWDAALFLAANEYPVSWMDPVLAAYLGVSIELVGPVLLAFGLATRLAALSMLALSLVIQHAYLPLPVHEFWAILFGWFVVIGAGPISLDRSLARGLKRTALPLARPIAAAFAALTLGGGPLYKLFIRFWMAKIFFLSGLTKIADFNSTIFLFEFEYQVPLLPPVLAAYLATAVELVAPVMLVAGLGTRLAGLALIGMTLVIELTYLHHIDHLYWLMLLGLIALRGPGLISLDFFAGRELERRTAAPDYWRSAQPLPHVVIVGGGFGGLAAAAGLRRAPCRITLVDRHNYHLFQPLLYQVATAGLSPGDIATPIRGMLREQANVRVLLGRVTGIDPQRRVVQMDKAEIGYDFLILATGARHSYFGRDDWADLAPGLKKIEDATDIRRRLLTAFERAEAAPPAERAEHLTFAIVGGGPTGVELAGAIAELARNGMGGDFRTIDPASARVLLIQSGPRVLPTFPEKLSAIAAESLRELGVEVMLDSRVEAIDANGVTVSGSRIAARTVFWAAGVIASPAAKWLRAESDRAGRIKVGPDLSVPGCSEVFAIGDTALAEAWNGQPAPGLAPAAKQGGAYVARVIRSRLAGRAAPPPFRYRHMGNLATIGRQSAVADFGRLRLSGAPAWWLWGAVHIAFLAGLRNRVSVAIEWFWAYLTFKRGTRLITGGPAD